MSGCSRSCNDKAGGNFSICAWADRSVYLTAQVENINSLASVCCMYEFSYIINDAGVQMKEDALLQVRKSADWAVC